MLELFKSLNQYAPLLLIIPIWFFNEALKKLVRMLLKINKGIDFVICYVTPPLFGAVFRCALEGTIDVKTVTDGILIGAFAGWTYPLVKKYLKKIFKS